MANNNQKSLIDLVVEVSSEASDFIKRYLKEATSKQILASKKMTEAMRRGGSIDLKSLKAYSDTLTRSLSDLKEIETDWDRIEESFGRGINLFPNLRRDLDQKRRIVQGYIDDYTEGAAHLTIPKSEQDHVLGLFGDINETQKRIQKKLQEASTLKGQEQQDKLIEARSEQLKLMQKTIQMKNVTAEVRKLNKEAEQADKILLKGTGEFGKSTKGAFSDLKAGVAAAFKADWSRAGEHFGSAGVQAGGVVRANQLRDEIGTAPGAEVDKGSRAFERVAATFASSIAGMSAIFNSGKFMGLITAVGVVTQIVKLLLWGAERSRAFERELLEGRGAIGVGIRVGSGAGSTDLGAVKGKLNKLKDEIFVDYLANNEYKLSADQISGMVKASQDVAMGRLARTGDTAGIASQLEAIMNTSAAFSREWGIGMDQMAGNITDMVNEYAMNITEIRDMFGSLDNMIMKSGVSATRFMQSLNSISSSVTGLGDRYRSTGLLLAALYQSKIFGGKGAEDLIGQLNQLFESEEDTNRMAAFALQGDPNKLKGILEGERQMLLKSGTAQNQAQAGLIKDFQDHMGSVGPLNVQQLSNLMGMLGPSGKIRILSDYFGTVLGKKVTGKNIQAILSDPRFYALQGNNVMQKFLLAAQSMGIQGDESVVEEFLKHGGDINQVLDGKGQEANIETLAKGISTSVTSPLQGFINRLEAFINRGAGVLDTVATGIQNVLDQPLVKSILGFVGLGSGKEFEQATNLKSLAKSKGEAEVAVQKWSGMDKDNPEKVKARAEALRLIKVHDENMKRLRSAIPDIAERGALGVAVPKEDTVGLTFPQSFAGETTEDYQGSALKEIRDNLKAPVGSDAEIEKAYESYISQPGAFMSFRSFATFASVGAGANLTGASLVNSALTLDNSGGMVGAEDALNKLNREDKNRTTRRIIQYLWAVSRDPKSRNIVKNLADKLEKPGLLEGKVGKDMRVTISNIIEGDKEINGAPELNIAKASSFVPNMEIVAGDTMLDTNPYAPPANNYTFYIEPAAEEAAKHSPAAKNAGTTDPGPYKTGDTSKP